MSATAARLVTADELFRMGDPPGARYELVDGALRVMSPAGGAHGRIGVRLGAKLDQFVVAHALGEVFDSSTGFRLRRDPDTVRSPDVAFVRADRLADVDLPSGYVDGAPDLAAEVVSPNDTLYEVTEKVELYLATGARLVWVLNPRDRTVTVYESSGARRILGEHDALDGGDVLPGFRCDVAPLFARVRRG